MEGNKRMAIQLTVMRECKGDRVERWEEWKGGRKRDGP